MKIIYGRKLSNEWNWEKKNIQIVPKKEHV
jgi:hypothetical protein